MSASSPETVTYLTAEPEPAALSTARQVAAYYIGDPSWADLIVDAYLNPERAGIELGKEMDR